MRNKLIDLMRQHCLLQLKLTECTATAETSCAECLADHLLTNGVILPPCCKVGDTVYYLLDGTVRKAKVEERVFFDSIHGGYSSQWRVDACDRTNELELSFDPFDAEAIVFINNQFVSIEIFFTRKDAEKALREVQG